MMGLQAAVLWCSVLIACLPSSSIYMACIGAFMMQQECYSSIFH